MELTRIIYFWSISGSSLQLSWDLRIALLFYLILIVTLPLNTNHFRVTPLQSQVSQNCVCILNGCGHEMVKTLLSRSLLPMLLHLYPSTRLNMQVLPMISTVRSPLAAFKAVLQVRRTTYLALARP